tara:strand:+ start:653 stop:970 length:318 start_codon:yes stop_codon:yes gene_type:complete
MTSDGKRLPYKEDYMKAAKKNMGMDMPEEMPEGEMPEGEMPEGEMPEEMPPMETATLQLTLTPNAIEELSKPENKGELEKLITAGIVAMKEGAEMMDDAMPKGED